MYRDNLKGVVILVKILTSGFKERFPNSFATVLKKYVKSGMRFVFVASDFKNNHEKTDRYCEYFLKMFSDCGVVFSRVQVVDSRMTKLQARQAIAESDVVWLAGGDTPRQYEYFLEYELSSCLQNHKGVLIGMSAGAINMSKTAVCTNANGHNYLSTYQALGIVDFSVEPHFNKDNVSEELITISKEYALYGICDDSAIFIVDDQIQYVGYIYLIEDGKVIKL